MKTCKPTWLLSLAAMEISFLLLASIVCVGAGPEGQDKGWRSAWISGTNSDRVLDAAKALNFTALIVKLEGESLKKFTAKTKAIGLESYYWFTPVMPKGGGAAYSQKMTKEEEELSKEQKKLSSLNKLFNNGYYQGGGEPLPGNKEVWDWPQSCFHHPEVLEATKEKVKRLIEENPDITGLALDGFGYPNYSDCRCPVSLKKAEEYRLNHPELSEKTAWDKFFLESLVEFQNEICAYARGLKPDIKITVHVWPTYLSEAVYGNRLDLDYCCQTAAWFFKPYWSDEKIINYTRLIVGKAQAYNTRSKGIPFIGFDKYKDASRFEHELRLIFENDPSHSLSIFVFDSAVEDPEIFSRFRKVFLDFKVIDK